MIPVPGLKHSYGLTSCAINNCLYTSGCSTDSLHRIHLSDDRVTRWNVGQHPAGLSVNKFNNVLVTCCSGKLQEFTTNGSLVREVDVKYVVSNPWHAVQLSTGDRVVVSHANQLCVVDASGRVTLKYGKTSSGAAANEFDYPVGLVQIEDGSLLVADRRNNRLMVIGQSLVNARDLPLPTSPSVKKLTGPWAIHFDESRGRLYVGEYDGRRILVYDNIFNVGASMK